jgi:hypothetical protein
LIYVMFAISLLYLQSLPVCFRICINLVSFTWSNASCQSMKQWHNFSFISKVRSDIILSIWKFVCCMVMLCGTVSVSVSVSARLCPALGYGVRVNSIALHYFPISIILFSSCNLLFYVSYIQDGSNMTGINCDLFTHNQSWSYLNHLVFIII